MKLICEVNENVQFITEDKENGAKSYFIEGIFMQGDVKNRNGRVYPSEVLARETKRYNVEYVKKNRAYGELGHPQGPTINLERVSHMITDLKEDGKDFVGKAKIMTSTPYGKIVESLFSMNESVWKSKSIENIIPKKIHDIKIFLIPYHTFLDEALEWLLL